MAASEFFIMAAIVIVGLIFVIAAQKFIGGEGIATKEAGYKAEAESLVSLINRIVTEPASHVSYCQYTDLANISIKSGILTYEKDGVKYSFPVSKEVNDVKLEETTLFCIIKVDRSITLSNKMLVCNLDSICALNECEDDCPDCYGPKSICVGDGFCNKFIGENCENSVDCVCDAEKICCPESPDADDNGCSGEEIKDLEKGEECWCTEQCKSDLECNPTKNFEDYEKACCDSGKQWNGEECVSIKVYHLVFVPIGFGSGEYDSFKSYADMSFEKFKQEIPLRDCADIDSRIEAHIIEPGITSECQITGCTDLCGECNSLALACANSISELRGKINKVTALCKGSSCGRQYCGCANGIPGTASSTNMDCGCCDVPTHEVGHTMGLGHVDCGVPCHACPPYANNCNCQDCSLSATAKRSFIMDYCSPMEEFGPAAYQCLKDNEFKDYMC